MPPSGLPPPARPAPSCWGCIGSSAPSPPTRYRRPPTPLRRPALAPGQPAGARPPAGACGAPWLRVHAPVVLPSPRGSPPASAVLSPRQGLTGPRGRRPRRSGEDRGIPAAATDPPPPAPGE